MTTLEIILTVIIWIGYGVFNGYQMALTHNKNDSDNIFGCFVISILFAPIMLVIRAIWGIFTSKHW